MNNRPIVIFGPSGTGKSTLLKKLMAEYPEKFGFSISHTTRQPRTGEKDGREYHFVNVETFKSLIAEGAFLEWAQFSGNYYGTSRKAVQDVSDHDNKTCLLDIDSQGVASIKKTSLDARYLFVEPSSIEVLKERLTKRGTETVESLNKRLQQAQKEIEYGNTPGIADEIIVNDDLDTAYAKFKKFIVG